MVAIAPFARVKQFLKRELGRGRYPPGRLMPSESQLVARFGVSRMTVNRALRELQVEGLIERRQGVGTFAAPLHRVSSTLTIRDLHDEIVARGHAHHAVVHLARREAASAVVAERLGVPRETSLFHTIIVHRADDVAVQCEDRYVNPVCAPGYLEVDFTRITPTHYLLGVAPLWEAQYSIEAAAPTAREARLLGIGRRDPCLIVMRRTVSRSVPITLARLVHPGSRYLLHGEFKP
ncbi:MAG: UTRA domain-containing protein [Gemmatimonadales bacterium]